MRASVLIRQTSNIPLSPTDLLGLVGSAPVDVFSLSKGVNVGSTLKYEVPKKGLPEGAPNYRIPLRSLYAEIEFEEGYEAPSEADGVIALWYGSYVLTKVIVP